MTNRTRLMLSASLLAGLFATPAMAQTPTPTTQVEEQDQAVPDETTEVDEIVVTGIRRSLRSAQSIKQNSISVVDAIVAEDIGKLPDTTASDSLARITGVQVSRRGGEAEQVLVRGLPDVTTTYNGRDIFTAETRSVAIQDFPAGGVAALEVYKTTSADQVEGGIAGLVNVRSRRPFDFQGREIAGAIRGTYANQSDKYDPNGNILFSDRWDTGQGEFGALLNLSYTQLNYLDSARFNGGFIDGIRPDQTLANPALAGSRYPDGIGVFQANADRIRPSANFALQWRPNDDLEIYADGLYQGYIDRVSDRQLFVPLFGGSQFTNVVLTPGANQVQSMTVSNAVRPDLFQGGTNRDTGTWQIGVGATLNRGPWRFSTDLARTDSQFDLSLFSFDTAFATNPSFDVNFDVPEEEGGVEFSFNNFDTTDPANYVYRGLFDRYLIATGDDIQWRADIQYDTGMQGITRVDFGVRYTDRDAALEQGARYSYQEFLRIPLADKGIDLTLSPAGFNGSGILDDLQWVTPTRGSIRGEIETLRAAAGFAPGRPATETNLGFTANEKAYAVYGQLRYGFEDALLPLDGAIGVRVVKTEQTLSGVERVDTGAGIVFNPRTSNGDYVDVLPNASARLRFTDTLQGRLSYTMTRTRPTFGQLNPALVVDPPGGTSVRRAFGGNVDLEPIESQNYDASLEWYFAPSGSATVAVFQRDISGFIGNVTRVLDDPIYGQLEITRPENLSDTTLKGVEAAFTTFFDYDFVPDWAQGFGVQANVTYIDGAEDLPLVSEWSYNAVAIYERGPISARLAYNFRSEYGTPSGRTGEFTDDVSRLDFSASYTPIENITMTFDVSNILGEPFRNFLNYTADATFPRDVRFEETIYSLGLRFRY